jgi:hypothetical protein
VIFITGDVIYRHTFTCNICVITDGHRQSMPNLSRGAPKLSLPLTLRSSDQHLPGPASLHASISDGAAAPVSNAKMSVTPKTSNLSTRQPTKAAQSVASRHPPSPTTDSRSRTMNAPTSGKAGTGTLRQPTRMVVPTK